mgnify:FL=1
MFNGGSAAPLQSAYDSRSFCRETSYYSEKRVLFKLIAQKVKNALSSRDLHRNGSFYTLQHTRTSGIYAYFNLFFLWHLIYVTC